MLPKERAKLLYNKYSDERCLEVINHMICYYIGINQNELELYWEQVEGEFEKIIDER